MRAGVVDAFCARPFAGNPAAVVLLDPDEPDVDDASCQALAAEFNLAETAFLRPRGENRFALRWFTPTREVPLCGHATLASAHWLWDVGVSTATALSFETASGTLLAVRVAAGVRLDLPAIPVTEAGAVPGLLEALGAPGEVVGCTGPPDDSARNALVVTTAATLRQLRPDFAALGRLPLGGTIVTAPGDLRGVDLISRYFAPAFGIDEDPVTGSAHCTLAGYWAERLGRRHLQAQQVSARGGVLGVAVEDHRVMLTGRAVTVMDVHIRPSILAGSA